MKKVFLLLFFVILLSSLTFAAPPIKAIQLPSTPITIEYPIFDYLKYNVSNKLHFHIYNQTGHILTNATTRCNIHIYNITNHVFQGKLDGDSNGYEFYKELPSSINNRYGVYSVLVDCNKSNIEFGWTEFGFQIVDFTNKNYPITNGEDQLNFLVFIPLIICFFFIFFAWSIPESMEVLRWFARFISILMLFPTYIIADIMLNKNSFFTSLQPLFNITIFTWIFFTLFAILMLSILVAAIKGIKNKKNDDFEEGNL